MSERRLFVAITGASGAAYARRLVEVVAEHYDRVYLAASDNGLSILRDELGVERLGELIPEGQAGRFRLLDVGEMHAPPASGSHEYEGMVVIPCSMGTAGRIASGISNDLITRAADVCLKERRKLIIVARETPLSLLHLENLMLLARAGAIVLPAAPAFYHRPTKVEELVDSVVDRVLLQLGVSRRLVDGWPGAGK